MKRHIALNSPNDTQKIEELRHGVNEILLHQYPKDLIDGAVINYFVPENKNARVVLGGNRSIVLDSLVIGDSGSIVVVQDAVGGRTLTIPANSKLANITASQLILSTTPNAVDLFSYYYDGTYIYWEHAIDENRLLTLENNEYKIVYFTEISSSTGTITIPTQATILLDQLQGGADAFVSTIQNGQPTGNLPRTSLGTFVDVSSFNALGNFVLTGAPSSYPVALIYCLKIKAKFYSNLTTANILDFDGAGGQGASAPIRTNGGNTAYSILKDDQIIYTGTAFTAPRTWTLPDASTTIAGREYIIADELQTVTTTNTLTIAVQTGQKLNGVTNGTELMNSAGAWRRLESNGVDGWFFDGGVVRLNATQTLTNKNLDSSIATTQSAGDNSTKIATTAYVDTAATLALKKASNLSDVANFITARNNLGMYDMFMTNGDQTTTSDVAGNVTDLVASVTANKRYKVSGGLHIGCNNTGGVKIAFTTPSGTLFFNNIGRTSGATAFVASAVSGSGTLTAAFNTLNNTAGYIHVEGEFSVGVTGGSFQVQIASGVNTQTSTIFQSGTKLTLIQEN